MKVSKNGVIIFLFLFVFFRGYAQVYRNGYKVNGVTVAGGNGQGASANQLNGPSSVCMDKKGNLYILDQGNRRIQRWAPGATSGETIAKNIVFNLPGCICFDGEDNLYITDFYAHCFYRYNLTTKTSEKFNLGLQRSPSGICADKAGNVFISFCDNNSIIKWPHGASQPVSIISESKGGNYANQLNYPLELFIDSNRSIYIEDAKNYRIQKWLRGANEGVTVAGATIGNMNLPLGLTVDKEGDVFVSEAGKECVTIWKPGGGPGLVVAGGNGPGNEADELNDPRGLCLDEAGNLYVTDQDNFRIQKFEKEHPYIITPRPEPKPNIVVVNPAPPLPGQAVTVLSWQKPVSYIGDLPDGVLHTSVSALPVNIKISSSANIDPAKIKLQLNGNSLAEGGKMRTVDLKQLPGSKQFVYEYTTTLTVDKGNNTVQLFYGDDSTEPLKVNYTPQGLNLYVLSIGTNAAGLNYTKKDALDFGAIFNGQQGDGKLFSQVTVQTLVGDDARAVAIASKINEWGDKQYGPNDVLFIFISSHGYTKDDKLKITGSDFQTTIADLTSIDFKEQVLDAIDPANCKKFVFLDACHSGAGITGGKAAAANVAEEVGKMIHSVNSTTIITSSSSNEQSWEDPQWGNGAFTKAIKEAFQNKTADTNGDGIVSMDELFAFISKRVPELVKAAGKTDYGGKLVSQTPKMFNPKGNVSIYVY